MDTIKPGPRQALDCPPTAVHCMRHVTCFTDETAFGRPRACACIRSPANPALVAMAEDI